MNILFMGTPDFAKDCLAELIENKLSVVGVYTNPDKPKGRGHKLAKSPVKELAEIHGIPVYQPSSLRSQEVIDEIKGINPDIIIVVAYGKILPLEILEIPAKGCINVHGSLLPKYRGAAPIQRAIIDGEKQTGVTIMHMAEGLDTGDIILKETYNIGENQTSGELFEALAKVGAKTLVKTLEQIKNGTATREVQNDELSTYAHMLNKEMAEIDFSKNADVIHNSIRGLNPWPTAFTSYEGKKLKVFKSEIVEIENSFPAGTVIDEKKMIVSCGNNTAVHLTEVLLEGSKRMNGDAFLVGRNKSKYEVVLGK